MNTPKNIGRIFSIEYRFKSFIYGCIIYMIEIILLRKLNSLISTQMHNQQIGTYYIKTK